MEIPSVVLPHVRRIHDALSSGNLCQEDLDRPLLPGILARLRSYPGRPTTAPSAAYADAIVFPVVDSDPLEMGIEVDVWMDGKRSDLRAFYQATLYSGQPPTVLLDDLRVP